MPGAQERFALIKYLYEFSLQISKHGIFASENRLAYESIFETALDPKSMDPGILYRMQKKIL
jgi:hypothetical protein